MNWVVCGAMEKDSFSICQYLEERYNLTIFWEVSPKPFIHAYRFLEDAHNFKCEKKPYLGNKGPGLQNSLHSSQKHPRPNSVDTPSSSWFKFS